MHYHVDMPVVKHEEAGLRKTEAGCTFMYTPCCVGWRNVATVGKQLHAHRINSVAFKHSNRRMYNTYTNQCYCYCAHKSYYKSTVVVNITLAQEQQ